jgi:methionine-rich copper-binding protein CopC
MAADYVFSFTVDSPPTVTSTSPVNGASSVPVNSTVTFVFSKAVNVTASAFTLACPTGTPEAFTLSPAPPGGATTYTLTPTASLPAGTVCTATAVASQIADLAGTHLAADDAISFTVDVAPTVTSTSPTNGATSVALNATVSFVFSKAVNVTASAFTLACPTGTPVAFTLSPAPPGGVTTYTLTPTSPLPAGVVCTATAVASQIADSAGTHLAADFNASFTTDTAPTVTSTTPVNGATQVPPATTITVVFSKAVNVTATAFKLECPTGTPEAFTVAPAPPGGVTTFTLTPSASLPVATTCTVTVVASQVTDVSAGTNLASDFSFSFTTGTPPTVTSTTPANGATAVLASSAISITFSKPVNVTAPGFKLECPVGTPEAFTLSPAAPGGVATFTLTPSSPLPAGATCTVTAIAADIADTVGNIHLAADYVFSFTVDTPPTVTSTTPVNGATTVALNTTVTFVFSKAVNVTASAFTLACPTGTPEAFTLSPAPPGGATTYTLTPTANLPAGTVCTATAVASQITDLAGTHLAANDAVSFTTDTPPTVSSTTPTNGATAVLANTTIAITFDKTVNVTASAFTLACPTGTPEAFTLSPAPPGGVTTYTLTPTANLPAGAVCTVTVVASQVTDTAAATPMAANFVFSFTVDTPPTVTSTTPANGTSNFLDTSSLTVTFNKAVNVTGASAFTIECPTGTPKTFTLSPAAPGGVTTFTLTPTTFLPPNVTCTATVVASQVSDLAGTQMAANFVWTFATVPPPPSAVADTYPQNVIGNVSSNSSLIPYSVTSNDSTQAGTTFTITAFDATTANGGTVSMTTSGAGIGMFTYNPPAGFTGTDTFTYTITNTGGSATATVSIPIVGIIWFINNNATAGDGRLASPFNSVAAFQAVNDGVGHHPAANANIFLYDSATAYTGPLTLLNGQKLIGQDATSSLSTITGLVPGSASAPLPATGGGSPNNVKITSAANSVTLGSGNTVWGLTFGNATGTALTGSSVGSLKIRDVTIDNTTGAAASLANGALDAILGAVTAAGGTHGIALTTTTGSFDVEGGGASDPTNTTRGRTTAKNGGGTLTLGSGGTISGATSSGVLLSNATNVTLRNMVIQNNGSGINNGGDGINVTSGGSSLTLDNDLIQGQTTNNGLHATSLAGMAVQHVEVTNNASSASADGTHVWDVRLDECTGTVTVANSLFHNSRENIFGVTNSTTTSLTLTVTNSQFSDTATATPGNAGLQVNLNNSSIVNLSVDGSSFLRNEARGVQFLGDDTSSGSFAVTNSILDANAVAIDLAHQGLGKAVTFNIAGNTVNQTTGGLSNAISVALGVTSNATTTLVGKIQNNTIGNAAVADSGSNQGSGIVLTAIGAGTMTTAVTGNNVVQVDNEGLNVEAGDGSATLNLTATGNSFAVDNASPNSDFGMIVVSGIVSGDTPTLCAHISGNTDHGNAANGGDGIALATEAGTPTLNLQGYGGSANNTTQIASFLDGANTDTPTPAFILAGAGTIKAAPAPCPTPP